MSHLEKAIAAPVASPGRIVELVTQLRSDSVDAPRSLSESVLSRLNEIANHHDGVVPLHGRLFAQWMHHAYPLECPFPHTVGTTTPLTPDEWMDEMGVDEMAAAEHYRRRHIEQVGERQPKVEALPWNEVEEFVVSQNRSAQKGASLARLARKFA